MLRDKEHRAALFESILESMGESVLLVDRDGKEIYGNKELRRFRGQVGAGEDLDAWRQPDRMEIFDADGNKLSPEDWPVARALRGDFKTNFEIRVRGMGHTSDEVVLAISTRSLVDASGEIVGAVIVTRDITAERKIQQQLQQSQKLETIGQLTGGVAHDFNNMLAAILSSAEVVSRGVRGNPRLEQASATIEKAALRGADLTRHLLAFARKQTLQPVATDINALVQETLALARPALGATIDILVVSSGEAYALVDPSQLTSALLNLCVNARDAMDEQGGALTISIETPHGAETVRIVVEDTGCGMSPDTMARAIEPFFTTKGHGRGTGLGLSMVFGFARQSGGDLLIESELGKGSAMTLILPRIAAPAPAQIGAGNEALEGRLRILVVDDDDLVREALTLQLNDGGFDAIAVCDGPEALARIDQGLAFDVLLTDVVMPQGISGVALAEEVVRRRPSARVLLSTGYVDREVKGAARWPLLRKPYTTPELHAALRRVTR